MNELLAALRRKLEDEGCVGEDEQGCTRDDVNIPLDRWCVNCLAGRLLHIVQSETK